MKPSSANRSEIEPSSNQSVLFESELGRVRSHTLSEFILFLARAINGLSSIETPPLDINKVVHLLSEIILFTPEIMSDGIWPLSGQ